MKKVLITGASGFIGRNCIPILLKNNYEVHAISRTNYPKNAENLYWHNADLLSRSNVEDIINRLCPDHLLHFAWYTEHGKYWASFENIRWLELSIHLLETFQKSGGKRAVVAGTCAEYDWNYGYCIENFTPLAPSSLYGVSKHSLHLIMGHLLKGTDISSVWGRIFFTFGPHENQNRFIPNIIRSLLLDRSAKCHSCDIIRDYLYVEDVADAFVSLLNSNVTGPVNIGSGHPYVLGNILKTIAQRLDREDLIEFDTSIGIEKEPHLIVADITRLKKEVGWSPKFRLNDGLDRTIAWWKEKLARGSR